MPSFSPTGPSKRRKRPFGGPDTGRPVTPPTRPADGSASLAPTGKSLRQKFKDVKGSKLRERLSMPQIESNDKRKRAILSVLRNRALKSQFGKDFRQKAYGDIEGYKPGLAKQKSSGKDLDSIRSTLAEVKERRKSYAPGKVFDPKTKTFIDRVKVGSKKRRTKVGSRGSLDV